jgi:flagellar motility protein MotE (MotC chaperone)
MISRAPGFLRVARAALVLLAALSADLSAAAEKPAAADQTSGVPPKPVAPAAVAPKAVTAPVAASPAAAAQTDAQQYCANIANAAADARFAWQAKTITDLNKQLDDRIAGLEAKRAELEDWLHKRDEMLARAEDSVVAIYAKMRPEAAALQLATVEAVTAAAVLAKLNSRTASAILNEMDPARAANLTGIMTDTAPAPAEGKSS